MQHEQKIIEIINRIKVNTKIVKDIRESVMGECMASAKYKEAKERFQESRDQMREIERQNMSLNDLQQLENAKLAIKDDKVLLTDIAMTAYSKGEDIAIENEGVRYVPNFKVSFQMKLL